MKAKRSNTAGVIALLLIGAAGVYGIGVYIKKTPDAQNVPVEMLRPDRKAAPDNASGKPGQTEGNVTVVTPSSKNGELKLDTGSEAVPSGQDPIVFTVNRYLQNSHIAPPEAKAISVDVRDGEAHISCTEAMDKTYGEADEEALIKGFQKTLSQFDNLK